MSTEFEEVSSKSTKIYRALGQGLRVFHDHEFAELDILAIPGLGANPEECWTWKEGKEEQRESEDVDNTVSGEAATSQRSRTASSGVAGGNRREFNWIRDADGLASLFPRSRIMLYDYASGWRGSRKVRATMKSVCTWLLDDLSEKRKAGTANTRPIIFIAHSMGGVVVAKTLCMAKARREFEPLVICTMGCAFFGSPFRGSNMAKMALQYSSVFGNEAYESLLSFMRTEKNDTLDEVTEDFTEICNKIVPPVELFCAWEQVPTSFNYADRLVTKTIPTLLQHKSFKTGARRLLEVGFLSDTHFVEKESAVLQGSHSVGLTAGHSDLIRFQSVNTEKFAAVRGALTKMVQSAKVNIRRRTDVLGQSLVNQKFIHRIRESLETTDMKSKFRLRVGQQRMTSWLTSETLYKNWLTAAITGNPIVEFPILWIKGGSGLGKTNASLTAIQQILDSKMQADDDLPQPRNGALMAFFLCEPTTGCDAAEDVLKSIITQLIKQQESLALYAKWFVPTGQHRVTHIGETNGDEHDTSGSKATATVENLWKCLQDMLEDPIIDSAHIICSNIHFLESGDSTTTFLRRLSEHAQSQAELQQSERRVRWLVTSRNDVHIRKQLTISCVSVIDLENESAYGVQVKNARRQYARESVTQLREKKKYPLDLTYYVRNLIESQSEDEKWIGTLCILLDALPDSSSSLAVRRWLSEVMNCNVSQLVERAWSSILRSNENIRLELEELLQTLTIAHEDPTLADLAVLTEINDLTYLRDLISKCSPIVCFSDADESKDRIVFARKEFKDRLTIVLLGQIDRNNTQRKRFHGLLALRCFNHIKASFEAAKTKKGAANRTQKYSALARTASKTTARLVENSEIIEVATEEEDAEATKGEDGENPHQTTPTTNMDPECGYATKHIFRHLSEGFPDVVHELCDDEPDFFTAKNSDLRDWWLHDFTALTVDLKDVKVTTGMTALHVGAGIGADEVVSILVNRAGKEALSWPCESGMTALHIAALMNQAKVVDTLIRAGADIEAGNGQVGTALHQAASEGHCAIMTQLISHGANVNAFSRSGPVLNAAIESGKVEAVNLIMQGEVRFDIDYTTYESPLSASAYISEPALFEEILETAKEKWLQNEKLLDLALIRAASNGRLESVRILLNFQHTQHTYTNSTIEEATLEAARETKWATVTFLVDYVIRDTAEGNRRSVEFSNVFYLAATSREDRVQLLDKIWSYGKANISGDICDLALYQSIVLRRIETAIWLLEKCNANPSTTGDAMESIPLKYRNVLPITGFGNPLNTASHYGDVKLVDALLLKGVKLNEQHDYALQLAAKEGHIEVVQMLLDHAAAIDREVDDDVEISFSHGTALQAACDNTKPDIVRMLLDCGANPNTGGGVYSNPITSATIKARNDLLNLLLDCPKIEINIYGGEVSSTPLINAATHMSLEAVELLIQKGADVDAQDALGDTALIMAASRGDQAMVEFLCQSGADITYKSPHRGLAIQAASSGSHSQCAHILAEKMGGTIETYRERVKIDPSKAALQNALRRLRERDENVDKLSALLSETEEQLEVARREIGEARAETAQLIASQDFLGQTYESTIQTNKAMLAERSELLRQMEALRGQVALNRDNAGRFQTLLNQEKETSATLRKRSGWNALQEEKQATQELLNKEREAATLKSQEEQKQREGLQERTAAMEKDLTEARKELTWARKATSAAKEQISFEQQEKLKIQDELKQEIAGLQGQVSDSGRALAEVLAAVRLASAQDPTANGSTTSKTPSLDDISEQKTNGSAVRAPAQVPQSPPKSQPSSPPLSSSRSSGGFFTLHGRHRDDGSFGGYRNARTLPRRLTTDSLYDVSDHGSSRSGE